MLNNQDKNAKKIKITFLKNTISIIQTDSESKKSYFGSEFFLTIFFER